LVRRVLPLAEFLEHADLLVSFGQGGAAAVDFSLDLLFLLVQDSPLRFEHEVVSMRCQQRVDVDRAGLTGPARLLAHRAELVDPLPPALVEHSPGDQRVGQPLAQGVSLGLTELEQRFEAESKSSHGSVK
jgi:hypothetical protein